MQERTFLVDTAASRLFSIAVQDEKDTRGVFHEQVEPFAGINICIFTSTFANHNESFKYWSSSCGLAVLLHTTVEEPVAKCISCKKEGNRKPTETMDISAQDCIYPKEFFRNNIVHC